MNPDFKHQLKVMRLVAVFCGKRPMFILEKK